MKREPAQRIAAWAFGIAGLIFMGAAVLVWITGGHRWGPVSLHEWVKPWWIGTGLLLLGRLTAAGPVLAGLAERAGRWQRRLGLAPDDEQRGLWWNWGLLVGGVAGCYFALHYYYLVPLLSERAAAVVGGGLVSALGHVIFFRTTEKLLARFPSPRRASLRQGLYLLCWSALIAGPLVAWEARFTEPVYLQGAAGLVIGLVLWWWWPNRRRRPALALALVLAVVCLGGDGVRLTRAPVSPERVLFITIDTVRADHLSCYGYGWETTPNLDLLAAGGVRFTRAYAPMAVTDPSHLSMLTGLYPRTHGVKVPMSGRLAVPASSLADRFLDRGFATAAITSRIMLDPWRLGVGGFGEVSVPSAEDTGAAEAYRRAMNWLTKNRGRDVLLWVHLFDPHQPYQPHPGFTERFGVSTKRERSGDKWLSPGESYSDADIRLRVGLYDGELAYMDHYIGKLLAGEKKLSPGGRPPLVVVMADHGEMLGEKQAPPLGYGFGHGGLLNQEVTHIPFIISRPGAVAAGRVVATAAETVDLAPTLTELLWGESFKCQGSSLAALIGPDATADAGGGGTAFLQRDDYLGEPPRSFLADQQYAVIKWPYKLLYTINGGLELYDLAADPAETKDLAPERPGEVLDLKASWQSWADRVPETKTVERPLTPSEREKLKALGYIK